MISDNERREVARKLRGLRGGWSSGECYYTIIHELDMPDTSREDGGHELYGALADLIEPSCDRDTPQKVAEEMFGKMRHSTKEEADAYDAMLKSKSVELHPVDRDALLALADDLDSSASMLLKQNDLDFNRKRRGMRREHAQSLMSASGRIREACGMVDAG